MWDQLRGRDNVDFRLSSQVTSLLQANGELTGLRLADRKRGTEEELKVDGLLWPWVRSPERDICQPGS